MPTLKNKVNFTKGWPSKTIVEEVLQPDTGVTIEGGFIGRRKLTDPDVWVLGVATLAQEPFIFRNESDDPDAGRDEHEANNYKQVQLGGVQGISFQNPLEVETIQHSGTIAVGDLLYADTDGKLKVAVDAAGAMQAASKVVLCVVTKAAYQVGLHNYIRVSPVQRYLSPAS